MRLTVMLTTCGYRGSMQLCSRVACQSTSESRSLHSTCHGGVRMTTVYMPRITSCCEMFLYIATPRKYHAARTTQLLLVSWQSTSSDTSPCDVDTSHLDEISITIAKL